MLERKPDDADLHALRTWAEMKRKRVSLPMGKPRQGWFHEVSPSQRRQPRRGFTWLTKAFKPWLLVREIFFYV